MPFILMRRTDIPNGVLQVDDLKPNDSQRNYTLEPPGQSGYVRNIPEVEDVVTTGAGPILILRDVCGLAAYLIDNVEDSSGTALTAAVANAAADSIVSKAQSGMALDLAAVDDSLVNNGVADATAGTSLVGGNSTGVLTEVLEILSGAKYQLVAGAEVEDAGNLFNPTRIERQVALRHVRLHVQNLEGSGRDVVPLHDDVGHLLISLRGRFRRRRARAPRVRGRRCTQNRHAADGGP